MKFPQNPPKSPSLTERSWEENRLSLAQKIEQKGDYLHWDKFRRIPIPEKVTHEELWHGMHILRQSAWKPVPLIDKKGNSFVYTVTDRMLSQLHFLDIGIERGIWKNNAVSNKEDQRQYLVHSLVQEAITSSQLEGAATTREVAQKMLRQGRQPRDQGEQMILNNYKTMQKIMEWREYPLTPELVCRIHRTVTENTLAQSSAAGRLRLPGEYISVQDTITGEVYHEPPMAETLPHRLMEMCAFANGETPEAFIHPVLRAIILHFWLAYDHPFVDGNGRTARALFYWAILRAGYEVFQYVSISEVLLKAPAKYARSFLYVETDSNDLTYFILYQMKIIEEALGGLRQYVERKIEASRQTELILNEGRDIEINYRQQALLTHALRNPGSRYSIKEHQVSHRISYGTARSDLIELETMKLLDFKKSGRRFLYIAPKDLATRLREKSPL